MLDFGLHCQCNVIAKHVRLTWLYLESILVLLLPKDSPVPKQTSFDFDRVLTELSMGLPPPVEAKANDQRKSNQAVKCHGICDIQFKRS